MNFNIEALISESESRFNRQHLPLFNHRENILSSLEHTQCLILQADTGLGKTTQLPQYLFLHYARIDYSQVFCTEPRKIAASGAAKRVNEEFGLENIAMSCANYKEMKEIGNYPIVYFSEFVFLNYLLSEIYNEVPLKNTKCLVLDEAHERNIETDVIMALMRKYVLKKRPDFKLIITSATLQLETLTRYLNCKVIACPGAMFPVETIFCKAYDNYFIETINITVRVIKGKLLHSSEKETILVFFSGFDEINGAKNIISNRVSMEYVEILMLYGNLDFKEQQDIVNIQTKKIRVVISTNIAESSLTVPGVTCVIDCGREKVSVSGQCKDYRVKFITKMSATQRKGRAGRTNPGICYRVYTENEYKDMLDFREPAILKSHIGLLVLKFMKYGIFDIESLDLLNGPDPLSIEATYRNLENLKMINKTSENVYKISPIGNFCLDLEISPMIAKFIYESYYNHECADEAAMLSSVLLCMDFIFLRTDYIEDNLDDMREDYLLHKEIVKLGDMVSSLFIFRQYFALLCDECLNSSPYCKCSDLRKMWAQKYYICEKRMKVALKQYFDICARLSDKLENHIFYFSEEEWELEKQLVQMSLNGTSSAAFQETLLKVSKNFEEFYCKFLQKAIITSFFQNLAQYRGDKTIDAGYLYIKTREIVVHHPCSPLGKQMFLTPPKYVIFYEVSVTSNLFMKYITPVDIEQVKNMCGSWLQSQNFSEEIEEPSGLVFQNLGPLYMREIFGPSGSKIHDLETSLKQKGVHGVLILPDMSKNCLKLRLPASFREIGQQELRRILNLKQTEVLRKNTVHIPFSKGMILVLNPGGIVSDLLYTEETLIFHLNDLRNYTNYSEALCDIQNTFEFYQFNYIKKHNENFGVVYFKSITQAEEAKIRLEQRPLIGKNALVSQLIPYEKSLPQPCLKIRTNIPPQQLKTMLEYYGDFKYINLKQLQNCSQAFIRYSTPNATDSCFFELSKWVMEEYGAQTSIQKMQQGILVPKELINIGLEDITNYIERINSNHNSDFHISGRNVLRIYAEDQKLNPQAKELIMDLVNCDVVPISHELIKCLEKYFIPVPGGESVTWRIWQQFNKVFCVYLHYRQSLAIYGLPDKRRIACEELQKILGNLLKQIVTVTVSYNSIKEMRKIELFKKKHYNELQIDININRRKASVTFTGIKYFVNTAIDKLKLEEKEPNMENCFICTEDLTENFVILSLCGHKFHSTCLNFQIKASFSEAATGGFPIICVICGHYLVHNDWCKVLTFNELQSLYHASLLQFISNNENFSHCENPSCDFVYQIEQVKLEGNKRKCVRCKGEFCVICKRQIFGLGHEINCEIRKMKSDDRENLKWIEENTAICPTCLVRIEKGKGCNHLSCLRCNTHFCFLCSMKVNGLSPIEHYMIPNTPCFQKYIDNNH